MQLSRLVAALTEVYSLLMVIRVLLSWVPALPRSMDFLDPALNFIARVTDPVLDFARRIIPPLGAIDFSPILAFYAVSRLGMLLANLLAGMGL